MLLHCRSQCRCVGVGYILQVNDDVSRRLEQRWLACWQQQLLLLLLLVVLVLHFLLLLLLVLVHSWLLLLLMGLGIVEGRIGATAAAAPAPTTRCDSSPDPSPNFSHCLDSAAAPTAKASVDGFVLGLRLLLLHLVVLPLVVVRFELNVQRKHRLIYTSIVAVQAVAISAADRAVVAVTANRLPRRGSQVVRCQSMSSRAPTVAAS